MLGKTAWQEMAFFALLLILIVGFILWQMDKFIGRGRHGPTGDRSVGDDGAGETDTLPNPSEEVQLALPDPASGGFTVEAFVSAGPRKSPAAYDDAADAPYDLCEDAVGITTFGPAYLWWLCDGTTGGNNLPPIGQHAGLSTRMLARDLGTCFVAAQSEAFRTQEGSVDYVARGMLLRLQTSWHERLAAYIEEVERAGVWDQFQARAPTNSDGCLVLKWSSTFLGGCLLSAPIGAEGALVLYQAGDSGALILCDHDGAAGAQIVAPNQQRVIVRATVAEPTSLQIDVFAGVDGQIPTYSFDRVAAFFAMSDGAIRTDLDGFLERLGEAAATRSVEALRHDLLQRRDKSYDDKSMVIARMLAAAPCG